MTERTWSYDTHRCGKCYYEGCEPCPDHFPKNEKKVTMNTIEQLKQNLNNQPKEKLVADFIELTNLYVDEIKEHCKTKYEVLQLNKAMNILLPKNEQQTT